MTAPEWSEDALCAEVDPEIFFVNKGGSAKPAKGICARCAVIDDCLEYAIANSMQGGIWGGMTDRERHQLRMRRAKEAS